MMVTPRDRVLSALRHERADRVPVDYKARNDVSEGLKKFVGARSIEEL